MPSIVDSGPEYDSEEERKDRKKARHRSKSRSRSRDKKKSKKHKKEKKHRRKRDSSAGDTGEEGGNTPDKQKQLQREQTPPLPTGNLPGMTRYESEEDVSDGGGGDVRRDERQGDVRRDKYDRGEKEKDRDREKRGDRKKKRRSRSRSRSPRHRRSRSKERRREDKSRRGEYRREDEEGEEGEVDGDVQIDLTEGGSAKIVSLSVEETNKLRAKLGLKPLNIVDKNAPVEEEDNDMEGTLIPGDRDKTRHLPPQHIGEQKKSEKLREKLSLRKEKRTVESRLAAVKGLGDSDSEEDAETWIQKQKSKVEAKAEADKRAKTMMDLDDEFGVADIVQDKLKKDQAKSYSSRDLKGLRVEHGTDHFDETETILTLQDSNILDEKYEDVLVNVNIVDTERTKKNFENIKSQVGYKAYDNEIVDDLTGQVKKKDMLYQYTEEIDGVKKDSFTLAQSGEFNAEEDKAKELAKIRQKLKLGAVQTLEMPQMKIASDYYSNEEMASFKKPKSKKKKIRKKMLKADDLLAMQNEATLPADFGNRSMKKRAARVIDDDEEMPQSVVEELSGVRVDDDDLSAVKKRLQMAKKLKSSKGKNTLDQMADNILSTQRKEDGDSKVTEYDDLILDQTQEFCRGLGENVSYENSGLVEGVHDDILDFEESLTERKEKPQTHREGKMKSGGWEAVGGDHNEDMDVDSDQEEEGSNTRVARPAILDEEQLAGSGMGAALRIASQMGYIEKGGTKTQSLGLDDLVAKKFSIEDKSRDYEEDDRKRRGRDRSSFGGPTSTFAEKKGYKPTINIEYLDDSGRAMNSKEAFRHLSHKFHGKGSGKIKTEKRQRKVAEEKVMERMSSLDTPLQTLQKQKDRAKDLATPYLVLTGNRQLNTLKK